MVNDESLNPMITVVLPVFNAGEYLFPAVLSVIAQTFQDWEMLIIDDGSTDNSLGTLQGISDPRIKILRDGRNLGLGSRLNEGIDLARGLFFARMDQDDISYPDRFSVQVETLLNDSKLDLVGARSIAISDTNEFVGVLPISSSHNKLCSKPWRGFYLAHPTWMGRIEWFRSYRYADPAPYLCEDQEMLLRSYSKSRFANVDMVLFAYRVRRKINWIKSFKTRWSVLNVQLRYFVSTKNLYFAFMAFLVFWARIGIDSLTVVTQGALDPILYRYKLTSVNLVEASRWREISEWLGLNK